VSETKPGFLTQIKSFPATFWVANTMEIFERMAWYGFFTVAALYITGPVETGALGFSTEDKGLILAIVPFFLYIMPVLTGALADRYGYRKMFVIAYIMMVAAYYGLGQFRGFWSFLGAFMFVAVAAAIFKPVVVGTVARVTDKSNSSTGFGVFYMMVNVGGFVGPIIAGAIRGFDWKYVFIACALWAAVNLVIVLLFYKEPTTEAGSEQARTFRKVLDNAVEVLGNLRFFITVFVILIALLVAGFHKPWFTWEYCGYFIAGWLVLNFLYDSLLPKGSGRPVFMGGPDRAPFARRMFCSNWRFALFLLIMSGFWTAFNQIFLTMPEYIRDFVDTKPMVQIGRSAFDSLGKKEWIDRLAAVEENELLTEFDGLVRRARGVPPMLTKKPDDVEARAEGQADLEAELHATFVSRNLQPAEVERLQRTVTKVNTAGADDPLTFDDLVDGARTILQYKVRLQPHELGELIRTIPARVDQVTSAELDSALATINTQLQKSGKPTFSSEADMQQLRDSLAAVFTGNSRLVEARRVVELSGQLSTTERKLAPEVLALGLRDIAYRTHIWDRIDEGRQVNPEHIVNFDAGAIILLQVLISFLMARFHRFTTMIIGMVVAAVGIAASGLAGGTAIGPVGGLLIVVIAGIVVFAVGEMMASPTSQEYVGRIAPRDKVALYMGYYFVAMALGNLFGGLLSGEFYGWLARDMQRPDLMWFAFGGIMLLTACIFLLYNWFVLPKSQADTLTPVQDNA
jgi:MFS family permease